MKKNILFTFVITLGVIVIANSCKKSKQDPYSDNGLPPATQNGQGIFACRLNGNHWISGKGAYKTNAGFRNDTLFAFGITGDESYTEMLSVEINGNVEQGMIYQTSNKSCSFRLFTDKSCEGFGNIIYAAASNGTVQLTKLDMVRKIISGTFKCDIPIPLCDTFHCIDGRFDIQY